MMKRLISLVCALLLVFLTVGTAFASAKLLGGQDFVLTKNSDGTFTLEFSGKLKKGEKWSWFVCSKDEYDLGELCWGEFEAAVEGGVYIGDYAMDGVFTDVPANQCGSSTKAKATLPKNSKWLFCAKTQANPDSDWGGWDGIEYEMLSIGGAKDLDQMKPGEKKGDELHGDKPVPKTGDASNVFLYTALLAVAAAGLVLVKKKTSRV